ERDGAIAGGEVVGRADDNGGLAVLARDDGDDARSQLLLEIVGEALELAAGNVVEDAGREADAADLLGRGPRLAAAARELPPRLGKLALEALALLDEAGDARRQLRRRRAQRRGRLAQQRLLARDMRLGGGPRHHIDTPHAGGDGALRDDLRKADIAGAADMSAAAELDREGALYGLVGAAHGDDAHLLAVFLAEERERARLDRAVRRHEAGRHLAIGADAGVHLILDPADIRRTQRPRVAEIEAHMIARDERSLLRHMLAEAPAQRLVDEVRHRMVGAQRRPPRQVYAQLDGVAHRERAARHRAEM